MIKDYKHSVKNKVNPPLLVGKVYRFKDGPRNGTYFTMCVTPECSAVVYLEGETLSRGWDDLHVITDYEYVEVVLEEVYNVE